MVEVASAEKPRTGRDIPVATAVGGALLVVVILSLFFRKELFGLVAFVAIGVGMWELTAGLRRKSIYVPLVPLLVGAAGILLSAYVAGPEAHFVSFLLTVGGAVAWRLLDGAGEHALRDASAAALVAAYLPFLGGFVMMMLSEHDGSFRVLLFIVLVVASDTGGYMVGSLLGRHRLAPRISPGKTWEGLLGSVVLANVVGVVGTQTLVHADPIVGIYLGMTVVATATIGDLSESVIKRDLGLKDMSTVLPGHGGVLDRLDSLVMTAPAVYLILSVFVPV